MTKPFDPDTVAQELCSVQPMNPNLLDPWFKNGGLQKNEIGAITASSHEPKTHLKTIQLDKETINDLIPIIDEHIKFINDNIQHSRPFFEPQRERLKKLFEVLDKLSVEK